MIRESESNSITSYISSDGDGDGEGEGDYPERGDSRARLQPESPETYFTPVLTSPQEIRGNILPKRSSYLGSSSQGSVAAHQDTIKGEPGSPPPFHPSHPQSPASNSSSSQQSVADSPKRRQTRSASGVSRSQKTPSKKKSKMHQCPVPECRKFFPRPSGLTTHMNSHNGAKPYKCHVEGCNKAFAVRSNAKRHLRVHGINPSSAAFAKQPANTVSRFATAYEAPPNSYGGSSPSDPIAQIQVPVPKNLKWVPLSLATRTNAHELKREDSVEVEADYSSTSEDLGELGDDDGGGMTTGGSADSSPLLSVPLPPVVPNWHGDSDYEERNSYAETGAYPYHPSQVSANAVNFSGHCLNSRPFLPTGCSGEDCLGQSPSFPTEPTRMELSCVSCTRFGRPA
ncbi:hypothetical protein JAAARDRAFT_128575 [Jaapia argillacea MUCL 33604]|uniref:C2H2-type domain-containing protein n=1 Tax=Jaapia argillacea MUCL 33604 TaxID=933084 RepID=A0A067Q4Y2_9AGAM|nr:hypothetical protein JAAARDRAFT_128575 [Jaapia argillacea MUCL 33604]